MTKSSFPILLSPIRIGEMEVRNRIVMPGMATQFRREGRYGLDLHTAYYAARAKGGAGLIIVESATIDFKVGRNAENMLAMDDDRLIPGYRELTAAVKEHGARVGVQLVHAGQVAKFKLTGVQPVGPSTLTRPGYDSPRELTGEEIKDIVARYAVAAERAMKAGFDGIEIHAAHRFLLAQFLSPRWNQRQDEYGGSIANRARLLIEVIKATRQVVGAKYPVWVRLNGREYGQDLTADLGQVVEMAQEAGVDAVNVSGYPGMMPFDPTDVLARTMPPQPPGCYADLAAHAKKVAKVPVMAVCRISPELGEKLLKAGKADLICMGRALIADPELVNKLASGHRADIRPCMHCGNCLGMADGAVVSGCTVNAAKGKELESEITLAETPRKVLVVGSGPAGLEAARVAALRGHKVELYEKRGRLGGQLLLAGLLKEEYTELTNYLIAQVKKAGVKIRAGRRFDAADADSAITDVVIIASGPEYIAPEVPGIDGDNVLTTFSSVDNKETSAPRSGAARRRKLFWRLGLAGLGRTQFGPVVESLSRRWVPFGARVIVMGGGLAGLELADYLVKRARQVVIVDTAPSIVQERTPMYRLAHYLFYNLTARGVSMLPGVKYEKVTAKGLVISDENGERLIEADTIVVAGGARANTDLVGALEGKVAEVHLVGDCLEPAGIAEAIAAGFRAGLEV